MMAMTDAADDYSKETPYTIASRIRKALNRIRDPDYAPGYIAAHAKKSADAANAELGQDFIPRPGYMTINSTWRCASFPSK